MTKDWLDSSTPECLGDGVVQCVWSDGGLVRAVLLREQCGGHCSCQRSRGVLVEYWLCVWSDGGLVRAVLEEGE